MKVLIVDDNALNLELAAEVLELEGFDVFCARTAEEGIAKAKSEQPNLILMDLRMPGMSGLDALEKLRNDPQTLHIPVVVLTASAMKGDEERLLNNGFYAYLQKPIDPSTFAGEVTQLARESTAAQRGKNNREE